MSRGFDDDTVHAIWAKAELVHPHTPDVRRDARGALIMRSDYGDDTSEFGWQIDHVELKAVHCKHQGRRPADTDAMRRLVLDYLTAG